MSASAREGSAELASLNAQIIADPANSELNLRYARAAEADGKLRWALAAYERVLVNDPGNPEAQLGLQRIRLKLQPNATQYTAEIGAAFESNPRYLPTGYKGELQGLGAFGIKDERAMGDVRWRTVASGLGQFHENEDDLNYAYLGATTGPVLDLGPGLSWHPAIGGAASYFDNRFFYGEANASVTFDDYFQGLYRGVRFRIAYRDYNNFFPSQHGFYADAVGKFSAPLGPADLFIVSPWVRWSGINGSVNTPLFTDIDAGAYIEGGFRAELYHSVFDWLVVGASFALIDRYYHSDLVPGNVDTRRDFLVVPGAAVVFPNLFGYHTDLRAEYRYQMDDSNDPTRSFVDHIVTTSVATRF